MSELRFLLNWFNYSYFSVLQEHYYDIFMLNLSTGVGDSKNCGMQEVAWILRAEFTDRNAHSQPPEQTPAGLQAQAAASGRGSQIILLPRCRNVAATIGTLKGFQWTSASSTSCQLQRVWVCLFLSSLSSAIHGWKSKRGLGNVFPRGFLFKISHIYSQECGFFVFM